MISVQRAKELEDAVAGMIRARQTDGEHLQRLIAVIADLQARIMAMEKAFLRPTTPAILGPNGARVN